MGQILLSRAFTLLITALVIVSLRTYFFSELSISDGVPPDRKLMTSCCFDFVNRGPEGVIVVLVPIRARCDLARMTCR